MGCLSSWCASDSGNCTTQPCFGSKGAPRTSCPPDGRKLHSTAPPTSSLLRDHLSNRHLWHHIMESKVNSPWSSTNANESTPHGPLARQRAHARSDSHEAATRIEKPRPIPMVSWRCNLVQQPRATSSWAPPISPSSYSRWRALCDQSTPHRRTSGNGLRTA